jgi:anaerobic carbon-monoxide dehydrogenase catalytic subunit
MSKNEKTCQDLACDSASIEILMKAEKECVETCFTRVEAQKNPCVFGRDGLCCRNCQMGPCRITKKSPRGVCGADGDTIVARNFLRSVCGGAAAHSDHGRHLVLLLKKIASGQGGSYGIKDEETLRKYAQHYGIDIDGRTKFEIAHDLANVFIGEFSSQEEPLKTLTLSPEKQQANWKKLRTVPLGIDRMIVESMHRTHIGVDHDYRNLLRASFQTSIADGWGGSRIASIVSDIIFGSPYPVVSTANLGVLKDNEVNIIVHGHEPALSEMLAVASQDPAIIKYANDAGAKGITLAGICCTANEILMRHGIPVAGNFLQQELAIITGAVEVMIIDVQCVMPSLPAVASHYHTKVISTLEMAKTIGAEYISFDESLESAKDLIRIAIDNYKNRDPKKVQIPSASKPLVAGFSVKAIKYMLGGTYRASFRPLNDAIIQGRIKGVVAIVGCNNARVKLDDYINTLTYELIKRDILVLKTGCAAIASAKEGLLMPEAALEKAGPGLKEICETIGIPPVLHMGSCVDNSRILEAATEIVFEGGLGDDISQIPAVGVAPEWMSEKAITIGTYFVASGVNVILGQPFSINGSENVAKYLNDGAKEDFGACFHVHEDPQSALVKILSIIDSAREKLGINKKAERKLFDMKARRQSHV